MIVKFAKGLKLLAGAHKSYLGRDAYFQEFAVWKR